MNVLITGVAGFVGSCVARHLVESGSVGDIWGIDNLVRRGSEANVEPLQAIGVKFVHGDVRFPGDLDALPKVDWIVDCAANPRVLAGVNNDAASVVGHNLVGTLNLLEKCRRDGAGFVLISTSRVYSIMEMRRIALARDGARFALETTAAQPAGVTANGIRESFSTVPPLSLYGATKSASETMALEYGHNFQFPVFVNRCGVIGGAGQFATPEQGIFAYWVHAHAARAPLTFIGFGGDGLQVRDCLHPADLSRLVLTQLGATQPEAVVCNVAGGAANSMSLRELHAWCDERFGRHAVSGDAEMRRLDVPWTVLDCRKAGDVWHWKPAIAIGAILEDIAQHAVAHPEWLRSYR